MKTEFIIRCRRVMSAANYLIKRNPVILRGAALTKKGALQYAWYFENLREKMSTGIYRFSFFKLDGHIREARGTLCMDLIPYENHPKSGLDPEAVAPFSTFAYYDLDKQGWRSFRLDNFIGFVQKEREKNQKRKPFG